VQNGKPVGRISIIQPFLEGAQVGILPGISDIRGAESLQRGAGVSWPGKSVDVPINLTTAKLDVLTYLKLNCSNSEQLLEL
jgi:hypothetical protein